MAVQQVQNLPAQFVQDLGQDLAKQVVPQSAVPVVSTGIAGISQQAGESAADFKLRQDAAQAFTTRQQSIAPLAPQVAARAPIQAQAQTVAEKFNDIDEATKEKDTRYYAVSISLASAKKNNDDDIPF